LQPIPQLEGSLITPIKATTMMIANNYNQNHNQEDRQMIVATKTINIKIIIRRINVATSIRDARLGPQRSRS